MRWLKRLEKVEEYVTYVLFLLAIIISLYGVFMRYVMQSPKYGLSEIIEICMTWAIFIGFGRALKEHQHIVVDIVYDKLPLGVKRVVATMSNLLGAGYSLYLAIGGTNLVAVAKMNGYVTNSDHIPIWITYFILPVGMYLLCLYFLFKTFKAIIGDRDEIEGPYNQDSEAYITEQESTKSEGVRVTL